MRSSLALALLLSVTAGCAASAKCATAAPPLPSEGLAAAAGTAPEVRSAEASARRASPSGSASITLLAEGQNAFVGRLELAPGAAVPEHRDPTEEYIHVLSGTGTLTMDGQRYDIAPGTTIFMPAHATVSFQNGDAPLVAIQVFAGPGPARKYDRWK